jgi:hypothetical protein
VPVDSRHRGAAPSQTVAPAREGPEMITSPVTLFVFGSAGAASRCSPGRRPVSHLSHSSEPRLAPKISA